MRARLAVVVSLCSLLFAPVAIAATADEIQHLLEFVENSGCAFIRNGESHDAREARSHIEHKYNYVKSRVSSAEDFIKYAATKSSLSGERYMVECGGVKESSRDWLSRELAAYRKSRNGPAPTSN